MVGPIPDKSVSRDVELQPVLTDAEKAARKSAEQKARVDEAVGNIAKSKLSPLFAQLAREYAPGFFKEHKITEK